VLPSTFSFKQEIIEVPGLLTALLITYNGVRDDARETRDMTWDEFLDRMSLVKPDWKQFDRNLIEQLATMPHRGMGGEVAILSNGLQPKHQKL